jgi:hypothetical protein
MEQVMCHVRRSNVMMKEIKYSIGPIDRSQGTLDPRPFGVSIMRDTGVAVLQPRVEDQPCVDSHVRYTIP